MKYEKLLEFLDKSNRLIKYQEENRIVTTPENARSAMSALALYSGKPPVEIFYEDRIIKAEGRNIPVRIYHPEPERSLPVMLYFHGGGHMCGNIIIYDSLCRKISMAAQRVVVYVEYRLSPEFPYPAAIEDCCEIMGRLEEVFCGLFADSGNLVLAGDSAGGAIAATLSEMAAENRQYPEISGQILVYPSLDYTFSSESYERLSKGYLLETKRISWYFDNYFKNGADRKKASPVFGNPGKLPPTLIIAGELDPLSGDARKYRDLLENAGISVEYLEYQSMIHAFMFLESLVPEPVADVYAKIAAFSKKLAL